MSGSELSYSAIIVVMLDSDGEVEELTRMPFSFDCWFESDEYDAFIQRVESAAKAISRAYDYWPDGYVSVQTRINRSYCNV